MGLVSAGLAAAPAPAAASADARSAADLASVRVSKCVVEEHSAVFHALMRRAPGTYRMHMRFTLLERLADGEFRPIHAPGLGRWRSSRPGVRAFGYGQRVEGLVEGASYKALVRYRWRAASGRVIARARRRSGVCLQ